MSVVLDSSVAVAFTIADERTDVVLAIMRRIGGDGAIVPSIWRLEVANALQVAMKRGRITAAARDSNLEDLAVLPIDVDGETDGRAWSSTLRLADRYQLTLYDAAYLELAERRALPLASLDRDLCAAARAAGVEVL